MKFMKKTFAGFLAILLVIGMMAGSVLPASAAAVAGDVNTDGKADLLDVMITLRLLAGLEYKGTHSKYGMFVNGDAFADLSDAVTLLRSAAGWDVALTAGNTALPLAKTESGIYYYEDAALRIVSQNVYHGDNDRVNRIERLRTLYNDVCHPEILLLQEYRWTGWFTAWEGANPTRTYLNFNKNGTDGNSYFVTVSSDSIMGAGYEGLVLSRAEVDQDTKEEAAALTKANGGVATVENAYQPDERLAIFWDGSKYAPAEDENGDPVYGMFYFSDTPDVFSASYGADPVTTLDSATVDGNAYEFYVDGSARIGIWLKLKNEKTDKEFYVFDLHGANLDDKESLEYSDDVARIITEQIAAAQEQGGEAPVVVGGDLNIDYYNTNDKAGFAILNAALDDAGVMLGDLRGTAAMWGKNVGTAANGYEAKADAIHIRGDILFREKNDARAVPLAYSVLEHTFDTDHSVKYETFAEAIADGAVATELLYAADHLGVYGEFVMWN